jgi:hypothetical protein
MFIVHPKDGRSIAHVNDAEQVFSTVTGKEIGYLKDGVIYDRKDNRICALANIDGDAEASDRLAAACAVAAR